ncbi:PREDICTED: hydroxysteroid dehydrogenase-like protein 2 [Pygoscelis adeliae]|nr:PREDICTED: hydroxysteroid dehydrogenase-like protein 2 [Pygoscelis adeliae]
MKSADSALAREEVNGVQREAALKEKEAEESRRGFKPLQGQEWSTQEDNLRNRCRGIAATPRWLPLLPPPLWTAVSASAPRRQLLLVAQPSPVADLGSPEEGDEANAAIQKEVAGMVLVSDVSWALSASQALKEEKKFSGSQREGPGGAKVNAESAPAKPLSPVAETFRVIQGAVSEEYVRATQGVFQFELSGDDGGTWYIDLKTKGGSAGFGKPPVTADVVMSMSSADFVKMFTGKLKPIVAFMSGKLSVKSDMVLAMSLEKMLPQFIFEL